MTRNISEDPPDISVVSLLLRGRSSGYGTGMLNTRVIRTLLLLVVICIPNLIVYRTIGYISCHRVRMEPGNLSGSYVTLPRSALCPSTEHYTHPYSIEMSLYGTHAPPKRYITHMLPYCIEYRVHETINYSAVTGPKLAQDNSKFSWKSHFTSISMINILLNIVDRDFSRSCIVPDMIYLYLVSSIHSISIETAYLYNTVKTFADKMYIVQLTKNSGDSSMYYHNDSRYLISGEIYPISYKCHKSISNIRDNFKALFTKYRVNARGTTSIQMS